jgi:hypothetical protein
MLRDCLENQLERISQCVCMSSQSSEWRYNRLCCVATPLTHTKFSYGVLRIAQLAKISALEEIT